MKLAVEPVVTLKVKEKHVTLIYYILFPEALSMCLDLSSASLNEFMTFKKKYNFSAEHQSNSDKSCHLNKIDGECKFPCQFVFIFFPAINPIYI